MPIDSCSKPTGNADFGKEAISRGVPVLPENANDRSLLVQKQTHFGGEFVEIYPCVVGEIKHAAALVWFL